MKTDNVRKFKTYEKAKKFLELRRRHAYRRIELRGDSIISDDSFATPSWNGDGYVTRLLIWTNSMIEDIKKYQSPDIAAELELVIRKHESNNSRG